MVFLSVLWVVPATAAFIIDKNCKIVDRGCKEQDNGSILCLASKKTWTQDEIGQKEFKFVESWAVECRKNKPEMIEQGNTQRNRTLGIE